MSRTTIGKKLTFAFSVMLVLALGLAVSSLYSIGKLGEHLDAANNKTGKKLLIEEIKSNTVLFIGRVSHP